MISANLSSSVKSKLKRMVHYWWRFFISIWYALDNTFTHRLNVHAASCTYYFLVSMVPAAVLLGWLLSNILIQQAHILTIFETIPLYNELQNFLASMQSASSSSIRVVGIVGVLYGLWSASSLVRGIRWAFIAIFDSPSRKKKLTTMILAYFFIPLFLVAIIILSSIASVAAETVKWVLSEISDLFDLFNPNSLGWLFSSFTSLISAACIALAAFACFFFLAPKRPGTKSALIGSIIFAVYFHVLQNVVISVMSNLINKYAFYGALGTLLALLLWAFLVFFGLFVIAEYTSVIDKFSDRNYYNYIYTTLKDKPNFFERFILRRSAFGDDYLTVITKERPFIIEYFKALVFVKCGTITVNEDYTLKAGEHKIILGKTILTSEDSRVLIIYESMLAKIVREHPDIWMEYWGDPNFNSEGVRSD